MTTAVSRVTLCDTLTGRILSCPDVKIAATLLGCGWFVDPSAEIREAIARLHVAIVSGRDWHRVGEELAIAVEFD